MAACGGGNPESIPEFENFRIFRSSRGVLVDFGGGFWWEIDPEHPTSGRNRENTYGC